VSEAFGAKLERVSNLFREALLESDEIDEEDLDNGEVDAAIQDFADGIVTVPGDDRGSDGPE
jgi:hypothetical protein